ncbi:unnamed protein product [Acanthosepion pharaonis]|uniref:Uncharacterized protein n=1 Tax=Acanthosepion pharaonis TaxID=158019 RepID=A0A812BY11_ACAPH|nr:unnamed protein product [Sepia pharaonis]
MIFFLLVTYFLIFCFFFLLHLTSKSYAHFSIFPYLFFCISSFRHYLCSLPLSLYLSLHFSQTLSLYLYFSLALSLYLSILSLSFPLSIYISLLLSLYLSILFLSLPLSIYIYLSIISVSVSVSLYIRLFFFSEKYKSPASHLTPPTLCSFLSDAPLQGYSYETLVYAPLTMANYIPTRFFYFYPKSFSTSLSLVTVY